MPIQTAYRTPIGNSAHRCARVTPCAWPLILGLLATAACGEEGADATENPLGPGNPSAPAAGPTLGIDGTPSAANSDGVSGTPGAPVPGVSAGPSGTAPEQGGPTASGVTPTPEGTAGNPPLSPTSSGTEPGVTPVVPGVCESLTSRRIRRISVREYANVVSDLLGEELGAAVLAGLPAEPRLGGFDNQASALFVSSSFFESVANLAEDIASEVDPAALAPCETAEGSAVCLEDFVSSFATSAYGRPPTEEERERITTVGASGQDYATSVRLIVEFVLQSPHFLYVSELGDPSVAPAPGQAITLTPDEMASQLSFLLRGARPDADLLQAVATNGLASAEDRRAQVTRLLAEARATTELTRFVWGWFDMAKIAEAPKALEVFPELNDGVLSAMQEEFDAFVSSKLSGEGTLRGFMTGQSAEVPAALLPIYGDDFDPSTGVDPAHRNGLLSLPAFLTYHASYHHSGPVERGLFVRRQLLCQSVPPPPEAVLQRINDNPIDYDDLTLTTRQKFEVHLDDNSCAVCHQLFDPIGFGLEEMDGIGRFRTTENGLPVDSTGALTGSDIDGPFEGVAELSTKLADSAVFETCAVEHFFRFAQSRAVESTDACVVENWANTIAPGGGRIEDLVFAYVAHNTFAERKDDR